MIFSQQTLLRYDGSESIPQNIGSQKDSKIQKFSSGGPPEPPINSRIIKLTIFRQEQFVQEVCNAKAWTIKYAI